MQHSNYTVSEKRVSLGIIDEKTQKSTNPKDQNN